MLPIPSPSKRSQSSEQEPVSIPDVPWEQVIRRVDALWVPDQAPHHSVIGLTGSGKSYLITRGILPLVRDDNVLIIDNKGGDPSLLGYGRPVRAIPKHRKLSNERKPRENWFHLVAYDDWDRARDQVQRALDHVWDEGGWTVIADEIRACTDPRKPNLNMGPMFDRMWLRGRSRKITVIAGTQAPRWVPSAFYDQCSFFWCGCVKDRRSQERIMEIGSLTRAHIPIIAGIRKRRFMYGDDEEDETFMAMTGVGA